MKRGAFTIIFISLLVIVFLLTFGNVVQGKNNEHGLVTVDNSQKAIVITPSGDEDVLVLSQIMVIRGLTFNRLEVDGEIRTEFPIIYVTSDFDKDVKIVFKTLWGEKKYSIKLILTEYIKFHIDGQLVSVSSKTDVASNKGFPSGEYTWYSDQELTKPYDPMQINTIFSLYTTT